MPKTRADWNAGGASPVMLGKAPMQPKSTSNAVPSSSERAKAIMLHVLTDFVGPSPETIDFYMRIFA